MLKHVSASCQDVSRRSLRHNTATFASLEESRYRHSTDTLLEEVDLHHQYSLGDSVYLSAYDAHNKSCDEINNIEQRHNKTLQHRSSASKAGGGASSSFQLDHVDRRRAVSNTQLSVSGLYGGMVTLPRRRVKPETPSSPECLKSTPPTSGPISLQVRLRESHTVGMTGAESPRLPPSSRSPELSPSSQHYQWSARSCISLPNFSSVTAIKVYAACLRPHLAYKTVVITRHTTSRQVVLGLLSRFRMRHRDPRLFYLTMEINIGGVVGGRDSLLDSEIASRTIYLEDNARLADLIECNPWGACRFRLKARRGGLVKIHDSDVRPDSVYKSIILSQDTTVTDTVNILHNCYANLQPTGDLDMDGQGLERTVDAQSADDPPLLQLYEVNTVSGEERLLEPDEKPLNIMEAWNTNDGAVKIFRLKRGAVGDIADADLASASSAANVNADPHNDLDTFSRSLVRNSVMRQTIRKKQFMKSMICSSDPLLLSLESPPVRSYYTVSRFNLSAQVIKESDQEEAGGRRNPAAALQSEEEEEDVTSTSGSSSASSSSGREEEEADLNSSTSGVSSLVEEEDSEEDSIVRLKSDPFFAMRRSQQSITVNSKRLFA